MEKTVAGIEDRSVTGGRRSILYQRRQTVSTQHGEIPGVCPCATAYWETIPETERHSSPCAQRLAHCKLALSRRVPRQQQSRQIRACDQKDQPREHISWHASLPAEL